MVYLGLLQEYGNLIYSLADLSWVGVLKIFLILLFGLIAYYFTRKYNNSIIFSSIKAKIVALEMKAEYEVKGENMGMEKHDLTVSLVDDVMDNMEKKYLKSLSIDDIVRELFQEVVRPLLTKR